MAKLSIILILLFSFDFTFAQNLTFKQLHKLQNKEFKEINAFLSKRGWQLSSDSQPDKDFMGRAVWAFNKTNSGEAAAWFILYYLDDTKRVLYNIIGGKASGRIRRKVQKSMSARHTSIKDGHRFIDYENESYVIRILEYKQDNYYGVKVFSKADYLKSFNNGRL